MVTIRDVAAQAQVSVSTVSHVINTTRYVDPATEQRVQDAIELLGYRPNSVARGLRRGETRTIGLIVPDNSNPFFADIARVIEDAGFAEQYSVILCNSDGVEAKEDVYIRVLLSKQVDGLILISSGNQPGSVRQILHAKVPLVIVDRAVTDFPLDQVMVDNEQGGYLAGQYLTGLGHISIGCIAGPSDVTPSAMRLMGFRRALEDGGLTLPARAIVRGDFRYQGGAEAMNELLKRDLRLTAVFAANDLMAIGAISALRRARLRVPDDTSILGFDNILQAEAMSPAITTIAQPIADMGKRSVALLLARMRDPCAPPSRVVLPTTLVERESCRARG